MASQPTADDVRRAVYAHYAEGRNAAVLFELQTRDGKRRRVDALVVRRAPKGRLTIAQARASMAAWYAEQGKAPQAIFEVSDAQRAKLAADERTALRRQLDLTAVEIKVTRADLRADIAVPAKQQAWRDLADRHVYCFPQAMADCVALVPAESGVVLYDSGRLRSVRPAPRSGTPKDLPLELVLDFAYRASRADGRARGVDFAGRRDGDDEQARLQLAEVRHRLELGQAALERAREEIEGWRRRFSAVQRPVCHACGRPLQVARRREDLWTHSGADEERCLPLRAAAAGVPLVQALTSPWRVGPPQARYPFDETITGSIVS